MRIRSLLRSKLLIPLVAVMLLLSVASGARATIFCVGCATAGAGCDVLLPGVGAALAAANANVTAFDTLRVAVGFYPESDATTMPLLGLFPLPDTIRVLGGWDPADCATQEDTIIPTNRTTTINAGGSGGIFDVISILFPFNLTVEGFTLTGGIGLVGVIGGAINMISAVSGSFTLTASNNVFINNNTLIGGAVSALTAAAAAGSVSLQNNFCFDNTAVIHGGCYSSISAAVSAMSTQGRNNIIAQNESIFGGGQGLTSVAASSNITQTRNNTIADNEAILGGGDFQANIVGATNTHNAVNDMTISNLTDAGLGNNEFIAGIGGVITLLRSRAVNLGRRAAGDVLAVGGGVNAGGDPNGSINCATELRSGPKEFAPTPSHGRLDVLTAIAPPATSNTSPPPLRPRFTARC